MKAPINRVLPTPVARAKQMEDAEYKCLFY
jgi:hypothetical protein